MFSINEERRIGFEFRQIHNLVKRRIEASFARKKMNEMELTGMQSWFIGYIARHAKQDVFQKDLEEQFTIRRSTATGILQQLEKKGMVQRISVEQDRRLKKLVLTPKAISLHKLIEQDIEEMEAIISKGITKEEKELFFQVLDKVKQNLSEEV